MNAPAAIAQVYPRGPRGPRGPVNQPTVNGPLVQWQDENGNLLPAVNYQGPEGPAGAAQYFNTKAAAQAAIIGLGLETITIRGYYAAGDGGGAIYKRVVSQPAHAGKLQSLDGAWWEIAEANLDVRHFGVKLDGTTDNTTTFSAAISMAAVANKVLSAPEGVLGIAGNIPIPSNTRFHGPFGGGLTIQKLSGSAAVTMMGNQNVNNICLADFTIDGNCLTIAAQFYLLSFVNINGFTMERVRFIRPYNGGTCIIGGSFSPLPPAPDGNQFNYDITIRDCVFDGTIQAVAVNNGDLTGFTQIKGFIFEDNIVMGSATNGVVTAFNKYQSIQRNRISRCWVGIYLESCQNFDICFNKIYESSNAENPTDQHQMGIWLTDAAQTFGFGALYGGNKRGSVCSNQIESLNGPNGANAPEGIDGIRISAPIFSGGFAQDLVIANNSFYGCGTSGGGNFTGVLVEGGLQVASIKENFSRACTNPTIVSHNNVYAGGTSETGVTLSGNVNT